jgi:putative spermidine/putrescine transport system ATP-binding protein
MLATMLPQTLPHALEADRITKRYGTVTALDAVSLQVARGQFLTLLGPSGSGKTTLLMTIAGFVQPDSGQLLLDGAPIQHLPPERRDFGMVFQGYALFPHLTVAENVAFPLRVRRVAKAEITQRVRETLDLVQLGPLAERLPRQLSGGQQQRVALARALVFRPSLLLLDEPLSALDKNLRVSMQDELKSLHQRVGLTFVCVTHDQEEALSLSDEVAILHGGRLVQSGTPAQLYERPASRFVAGFLGRSNFWRGRVDAPSGDGFRYWAGDHSLVQSGPCPTDEVLIALRPEKLSVVGPDASSNRDGPLNQVDGLVAASSYLGDAWLVKLDVPGLGQLQLVVPTWRGIQSQPGDTLRVGWDPDASVAITDDEKG